MCGSAVVVVVGSSVVVVVVVGGCGGSSVVVVVVGAAVVSQGHLRGHFNLSNLSFACFSTIGVNKPQYS